MFHVIAWVVLIAATLLFSLLTFFWALRSGQFSDQERARFLPLRDLPPAERAHVKRRPFELYMLSVCVLSVGAALIACILLGLQAV